MFVIAVAVPRAPWSWGSSKLHLACRSPSSLNTAIHSSRPTWSTHTCLSCFFTIYPFTTRPSVLISVQNVFMIKAFYSLNPFFFFFLNLGKAGLWCFSVYSPSLYQSGSWQEIDDIRKGWTKDSWTKGLIQRWSPFEHQGLATMKSCEFQ